MHWRLSVTREKICLQIVQQCLGGDSTSPGQVWPWQTPPLKQFTSLSTDKVGILQSSTSTLHGLWYIFHLFLLWGGSSTSLWICVSPRGSFIFPHFLSKDFFSLLLVPRVFSQGDDLCIFITEYIQIAV